MEGPWIIDGVSYASTMMQLGDWRGRGFVNEEGRRDIGRNIEGTLVFFEKEGNDGYGEPETRRGASSFGF